MQQNYYNTILKQKTLLEIPNTKRTKNGTRSPQSQCMDSTSSKDFFYYHPNLKVQWLLLDKNGAREQEWEQWVNERAREHGQNEARE